jgi:hypothetical protein
MKLTKVFAGLSLTLALAPAALAASFSPTPDWTATESVAAVTPPVASGWQVYVDQVFTVGQGFSYSPAYHFGPQGAKLDAVKVELYSERGACKANLYSLEVITSPGQVLATRLFPDAEGVFDLQGATLYDAVVILQQAAFFNSQCGFRLLGLAAGGADAPGDTTDGNDFSILGAVAYAGGFAQQDLDVGGAKVTQFWVRVPQFCSGVEVLEAGTVTEGQYDKARVVDPQKLIFEVNGGTGSRASAVRLILNGPQGPGCDIPVFVK